MNGKYSCCADSLVICFLLDDSLLRGGVEVGAAKADERRGEVFLEVPVNPGGGGLPVLETDQELTLFLMFFLILMLGVNFDIFSFNV